jgi:lysophospholipase L1-like esterase
LSTRFRRFVAIGDSQTEGVGDELNPDGSDRGWADRLAQSLAIDNPGLLYANLAIRGRCIGPIRDEQLEPALALEPDLVSVIGGANDLIRPGLDLEATLAIMDEMQVAFRSAGATVLTNTYPVAPGSGPFGPAVAERFRAYNSGLRELAARNGVLLIDLETISSTVDPRLWAHDRLHLNPEGHRRLAEGMLALIRGEADGRTVLSFDAFPSGRAPEWASELPPLPVLPRITTVRRDLGWAFRYLLPWIGRRVTGRSSGDGRSAKRPELKPVGVFSEEPLRSSDPVSGS